MSTKVVHRPRKAFESHRERRKNGAFQNFSNSTGAARLHSPDRKTHSTNGIWYSTE